MLYKYEAVFFGWILLPVWPETELRRLLVMPFVLNRTPTLALAVSLLALVGTVAAGQQGQPSAPAPGQGAVLLEERSMDTTVPTPDPTVSYRLVSGGFVSRTTDGGATWNGQLVSPNAALKAGSAPSTDVCWVVGHHGAIYLTTNGGTAWKKVPAPANKDFTQVLAKDGSAATITRYDGKKYSTTDGGKRWQPVP